jgi:hypothetical protein
MEYTMERTNPSIKDFVVRQECRHCHSTGREDLCEDCGRCPNCQCSPNCVTRKPAETENEPQPEAGA